MAWGLGRAAVCDCGTPWTFLLPFLTFKYYADDLHEISCLIISEKNETECPLHKFERYFKA